MRSKNFVSRTGKTNLRGNREKKIEKRTNWDRIVYLIFISLLVVVFGYIFIKKIFFVSGKGFLMDKSMEVRAPEDLKISSFFVSSLDSVFQGKSLFNFVNVDDEGIVVQNNALQLEFQLNMEKELNPLKNEAALLLREIAILRENLSFYKEREAEITKKIKLDIATMNNLTNVQNEIQDIFTKIKLKEAELSSVYTEQINIKNHFESQMPNVATSNGDNFVSEYFSPIEGKVDEIFVAENEMVFESEPIMSIRIKGSEVFIIAKFDRDKAKYLLPGTEFNIEFASGETSKGVVRKNYVPKSNYRTPENQYKENIQNFVAVNLYPADEETARIWKDQQETSVKVWRSIF